MITQREETNDTWHLSFSKLFVFCERYILSKSRRKDFKKPLKKPDTKRILRITFLVFTSKNWFSDTSACVTPAGALTCAMPMLMTALRRRVAAPAWTRVSALTKLMTSLVPASLVSPANGASTTSTIAPPSHAPTVEPAQVSYEIMPNTFGADTGVSIKRPWSLNFYFRPKHTINDRHYVIYMIDQ